MPRDKEEFISQNVSLSAMTLSPVGPKISESYIIFLIISVYPSFIWGFKDIFIAYGFLLLISKACSVQVL